MSLGLAREVVVSVLLKKEKIECLGHRFTLSLFYPIEKGTFFSKSLIFGSKTDLLFMNQGHLKTTELDLFSLIFRTMVRTLFI